MKIIGYEFKIITKLTLEDIEQIKKLIPVSQNLELDYIDELKFDEE